MRTIFHPNSLLRAGAALALAGSFSAGVALAQATTDDGHVQAAVTAALANDPGLQGQAVKAYTSNGQVTLSGTVQTPQQQQEAETVVAKVPGVVGIADHIEVAGQAAQAPPPPPQENPPAATQPEAQQPPAEPQAAPGNTQNPPPPPPDQTPARAPYQPYQGYGSTPPPSGPVTVPAGTLVQIRTSEPLNVTQLKEGAAFEATVASDIYQGNVLAIPRGAVLQGTVVKVKKPGALGGSGELELQLTQLDLGGKTYPLATDIWTSKEPNKAGYTASNTAAGAVMGAIIGGLVGRGPGAAVGALAGGGAGLLVSGETNGPRVVLPPEALLNFHLSNAITVQPVSWQEAQRLAQSVPRLQRRPVVYAYPYPYRYAYYPYPYYYPY